MLRFGARAISKQSLENRKFCKVTQIEEIIRSKTIEGRTEAAKATQNIHVGIIEQRLQFESFIDKMIKLQKLDKQWQNHLIYKEQRAMTNPVTQRTPLRDTSGMY